MKTIPIKAATVDMASGESATRVGLAGLMPPHPGACQACGRYPAHAAEDPHNAQSLYYQYAFCGKHGRWPTWKDAVDHCPNSVKEMWERELRAMGARGPSHKLTDLEIPDKLANAFAQMIAGADVDLQLSAVLSVKDHDDY